MYGKMMKMMRKNKKGFTLVELMVVVVILGILVAIAIPIYNTSTASAQAAADDSNAKNLNAAVALWAAAAPDTNVPTDLADVSEVKTALSPNYIAADEWDDAVVNLTWSATTGRFTVTP